MELVAVMIIIGVIAAVTMPRLLDRSAFDGRGFYDQTLAMLRYAQKTAIAQRTQVFVNVSPAAICLSYVADANCNGAGVTYVRNPADQSNFIMTPPSGVSLSGSAASFAYSGLGRPTGAVTLTIAYDGITRTIAVEAETGYVH